MIGSKSNLAETIISFFPPYQCYVEVFGGSGAVLLTKPPSEVEIYNDVNSDLVNFILQVRDNLDRLRWVASFTPYSRKLYYEWKKEWKKKKPEDPIERAARWFYLQCSAINQQWGAGWSHSSIGNGAIDYQRKCERLVDVARRLARVVIENEDFAKLISTYDSENTLFYCDPPYLGIKGGREYYGTGFKLERHKELAKLLHEVNGKAIVTYYSHPLVLELYKDWFIYPVDVTKSTGDVHSEPKEAATELILTNFEPLPLFRGGLNVNQSIPNPTV